MLFESALYTVLLILHHKCNSPSLGLLYELVTPSVNNHCTIFSCVAGSQAEIYACVLRSKVCNHHRDVIGALNYFESTVNVVDNTIVINVNPSGRAHITTGFNAIAKETKFHYTKLTEGSISCTKKSLDVLVSCFNFTIYDPGTGQVYFDSAMVNGKAVPSELAAIQLL